MSRDIDFDLIDLQEDEDDPQGRPMQDNPVRREPEEGGPRLSVWPPRRRSHRWTATKS